MDGDLAPLAELAELAERYGAMLLVDEAHATGVFGRARPRRGRASWASRIAGIRVRVGTLSKALGCVGGFVAGSRPLVEWLVNRARPYVFFHRRARRRRGRGAGGARHRGARAASGGENLLARAEALRGELAAAGLEHRPFAQSDHSDHRRRARACGARFRPALREHGLFVPAIRPPTVPEGEACLRISLTGGHTEEMIARLLEAMGQG